MSDRKEDLRRINSELIRQIYAGVLHPSEYSRIFDAWDKHFELVLAETGDSAVEDFDWANEFVHHFEQAGRVFDSLQPEVRENPETILRALRVPALLVSTGGRIVERNDAFRKSVPGPAPERVLDLALDPPSETSLRRFLHGAERNEDCGRLLFRIYPDGAEAMHFTAETLRRPDAEPLVLVKSVTGAWSEQLEATLKSAFGLTAAETALLADLHQGLTIAAIAERKGRSPTTLRTQLSAVLHKVGARSQAQLSRIVAGLAHLVQSQPHGPARGPEALAASAQWRERVDLPGGLQVELVLSGARKGHPVYFLQPTTLPVLTPEIVAALKRENLCLISPLRPGCGETTRTPTSFSAGDWARVHLDVLDRLGIDALHVGGHCSGGIYALELAALAGARCRSVLLVDTGAPLTDVTRFHAMPAAPRRLFLAARYFPAAITTPIKLVAADFLSGPEGEARGVAYFYDGSPADQAIIDEGAYWRITRDNMAYCFANVPQLAADIALWSRNSAPLMRRVMTRSHIRFLHGGDNLMMPAAAIERFCARHANATCRIVPGAAQLLIYRHPTVLAEEFRHCVDTCP